MMTPSKFLVTRFKLLCVNITVLTGIDVDLDSDFVTITILALNYSDYYARDFKSHRPSLEPRGQRSRSTRT